MRGDFSRRTFKASRHYSSVRLQQGRVLVDADWHEQIDTTGNGGAAWTPRPVSGLNTTLRAVHYATGSAAVAVGDSNRIVLGSGSGPNGTPNWAPAASVPTG